MSSRSDGRGKNRQISGKLESTSIPELFFLAHDWKITGMLYVKHEDRKKGFYFQNEKYIYAISNDPAEQLTRFLIDSGAISKKDVMTAKRECDNPIEEVNLLVKRGRISEMEVRWWTKIWLREVTFNTFPWTSGKYKFNVGKAAPPGAIVESIDIIDLLYKMLRQVNDVELIKRWLGSFDQVPELQSKAQKEMMALDTDFSAFEEYLLTSIDGKKSLKDIMSLAGQKRLIALKFIYYAVITGFIELKTIVEESVPETRSAKEEELNISWKELSSVKLTQDDLNKIRESQEKEEEEERADISMSAKTSYFRDGREVKDDEALSGGIDPGALKDKARIPESENEKISEDKVIYIIDGEEIDGESVYLIDHRGSRQQEETDVKRKSIEDMWEEWLKKHDEQQKGEEYSEPGEVEARWLEWIEYENEKKMLEEQKRQLEHEEKSREASERDSDSVETFEDKLKLLEYRKKQDIINWYRRSKILNYYELMCIGENAEKEEIDSAYQHWNSQFNPDKKILKTLGPLGDLLVELHDKIEEVYDTLSDPEKRSEYDKLLEQKRRQQLLTEERKQAMAENNFIAAKKMLEREDIRSSIDYCRAAISLNSKKPEFYRFYGEILSSNPKWRWEAMKNLNKAIKLEPTNSSFYIDIGRVFSQMGQKSLARKAFKMSIRFQPNNPEALLELNKL